MSATVEVVSSKQNQKLISLVKKDKIKSSETKEEDNDSGVEDGGIETESTHVNVVKKKKEVNKYQKPVLTRSRRGSIWNLFKVRNSKSWTIQHDGDDGNHAPRHASLSRAESCPAVFPKLSSLPRFDTSSKTSDLGDSIPSTPVSTISSTYQIETPGLVGMHNLGNSCYLNSVLQCLAHMDIIGEYYALDHFLEDIAPKRGGSRKNKSGIKTVSTYNDNNNNNNIKRSQLTYTFSQMIKSLWQSDLYSASVVEDFHDMIGYYDQQYHGAEQQDAQEFLMWLIDKVHEESVKVPKVRQRELKHLNVKKKKNQCEDEQAVIAFASHTKYIQSYIQGLFLSQYRSTITCPNCNKQSSTFDPYTCVSLSIPQLQTQPVYVTVAYSNVDTKPLKLAFNLSRKTSIAVLKQRIKDKVKLEDFIIVELQHNGTPKILEEKCPIGVLSKQEYSVYAVEIGNKVNKAVDSNTSSESKSRFVLVISNVEMLGKEYRRFGVPITINSSKDISFKQIQVLIRKTMSEDVRKVLNKTIKEHLVKLGLRIVHPQQQMKLFLNNALEFPLKTDPVNRALVYDVENKLEYLYLVAEWEPVPSGWYASRVGITLPQEDESCKELRAMFSKRFTASLEDCLQLQTQEEKLEDVWKCPSCRTEQHGVTKKLTLWSLPDILVLHLKRFDQLHEFNGKISTLVEFPTNGLNMTPHVATSSSKLLNNKQYLKQSARLNYQPPPQTEEQCMYDLKAVCNHIGSHLNSGHYTATTYNSVNGYWYNFDDRNVHQLSEKDIVTPGAYLLFYQRRDLSSRIPDNIYMSVSKAMHSPLEHWSYKMLKMYPAGLHNITREDENEY